MYTYEDAVKQLQETGHISLLDFKTLSYDDLEELLDEIKKWCVYANGNTDKLEKKSKKKKKKFSISELRSKLKILQKTVKSMLKELQ